jgi:lauroyl/myristoyl acyltransferase
MTIQDRAVEWAYGAGWAIVRLMPERIAARLFRAGADRAFRKRGPATDRLAVNLRQVVGAQMPDDEFDLVLRDALRSYARYWMEAFRAPTKTREQHRDGFALINDGLEDLLGHTQAGQGVILSLAHVANWDAAGAWVVANGMDLTTVAERLKPEGVYQKFLAYRRALGMEILPLTGGDRNTLGVLTDRLRAGAVVPLLADRDFSQAGVEVDFFGQKTKMPPGPAILALRTGAPMYVVNMWYEPDHCWGSLDLVPMPDPGSGPLNQRVREMTQSMADRLAAGIAKHPADWHMLARMFPPPGETGTDPETNKPAGEAAVTG